MALLVLQTTDHKYQGLVMPIDPRNPPDHIQTADGAVFRPVSCTQIDQRLWRVSNANYVMICMEM